MKCVIWFFYDFCQNFFLLWQELSEILLKCILVFVYSTRYSCPILMKLEFSRKILEKYSNLIKIRLVGTELFYADGRTDRHDETNSRFSQFCERA